jgi:hypothetical protein
VSEVGSAVSTEKNAMNSSAPAIATMLLMAGAHIIGPKLPRALRT